MKTIENSKQSTSCELAPVIIVTLCRFEHFVRCVESLKKNALAIDTDLYIGLDYPLHEKHMSGYIQIKEYLKSLTGFKNIYVVEQEVNAGPRKNAECVKEIVRKKYSKFIFSEDDNEFSLNYLEYMNFMLDKYEKNKDIIAVSGYMYPLNSKMIDGNTLLIDTYFAAFGYGIWIDREQQARGEICMKEFKKYYFDRKKMRALENKSRNQYCNFVKGMLGYIPELVKNGEIEKIDLAFGIYMFFNNKKMIFPAITKVKNWGYDGSGVHCHTVDARSEGNTYRTYDFRKQVLDQALVFEEDQISNSTSKEKIDQWLDGFFVIPQGEFIKSKLAYEVSRVFGLRLTRRLIQIVLK